MLSELANSFHEILVEGDGSSAKRLDSLRKLVLLEGLPKLPAEAAKFRPILWKLFLDLHRSPSHAPAVDAATYYDLTIREPSKMYLKIKNDAFRTLATDKVFAEIVGEERLVRVLEAYSWRKLDAASAQSEEKTIDVTPYVQGMNVLLAPFLFVLPSELEAFTCFSAFIEIHCPQYIQPTLEAVHVACQLVDECLKHLDPALSAHLASHNLTAELYAFPSLLTFSACTPPLEEVIELWDFLLAYGVGLNILCVVSQLWRMREEILSSPSPMKLLRTFQPLNSREIITMVISFIEALKEQKGLFSRIISHPWKE